MTRRLTHQERHEWLKANRPELKLHLQYLVEWYVDTADGRTLVVASGVGSSPSDAIWLLCDMLRNARAGKSRVRITEEAGWVASGGKMSGRWQAVYGGDEAKTLHADADLWRALEMAQDEAGAPVEVLP